MPLWYTRKFSPVYVTAHHLVNIDTLVHFFALTFFITILLLFLIIIKWVDRYAKHEFVGGVKLKHLINTEKTIPL